MGIAKLFFPMLAHASRYDNAGGVMLAMMVFSPIWILSLLILAPIVYYQRKEGEKVGSTVLYWIGATFILWVGIAVSIAFQ